MVERWGRGPAEIEELINQKQKIFTLPGMLNVPTDLIIPTLFTSSPHIFFTIPRYHPSQRQNKTRSEEVDAKEKKR